MYSKLTYIVFLIFFIRIGFSVTSFTNNIDYKTKRENNLTKKDSVLQDSVYQIAYKNYSKGKYPEALKLALTLHNENSKNQEFNYKYTELLGDIYNKTLNLKLSLQYFKTSLSYLNDKNKHNDINLDKTQYLNLLAKNYLKVGSIYLKIYKNLKHKQERNLTYLKLLEEGITKKHVDKNNASKGIKRFKDSALYFFSKLDKTPSINNEIINYKASSHVNLSALYQIDSMYSKSKYFALKAIDLYKEKNNIIKLAKAQSNLGNVYLLIGEFKKAKETYISGIDVLKKDNSQTATKLKANLYYNLAWAMRNLKDYKAYDYQEISFEFEDVLKEKNISQIIKKIEANHQENLEQQKVNLVTEQRKLKEAQQSKTTLLFAALSLLVIIISGVVVYNYKLRQKNLQLKLSENNLLQQQSIEKIKSDAHTKILNATIDGKESERKQIAETLHDNVSALLSSANMHLSATKKQFKDNAPLEIEKTQAIILEASQKVRDLSHNLISSILLKFGLEYALKDAAKKYSNSQLNFKVSAHNINRYNQEFEIKIFNIIQELANNILKHSKANYAQITIKQEKNQLTILVNDDGVGFLTSSSSINDGIGLNQIEARLKMMEGKLSINSKKNKGTKISIIIPIQEQKQFKLSSVS